MNQIKLNVKEFFRVCVSQFFCYLLINSHCPFLYQSINQLITLHYRFCMYHSWIVIAACCIESSSVIIIIWWHPLFVMYIVTENVSFFTKWNTKTYLYKHIKISEEQQKKLACKTVNSICLRNKSKNKKRWFLISWPMMLLLLIIRTIHVCVVSQNALDRQWFRSIGCTCSLINLIYIMYLNHRISMWFHSKR